MTDEQVLAVAAEASSAPRPTVPARFWIEAAVRLGIVAPVPAEADGCNHRFRKIECGEQERCSKCGEPRHIVAADKFECAESPAPADVERVARAMWDTFPSSAGEWDTTAEYNREWLRGQARAAIAAMPRPSREQIMASLDDLDVPRAYASAIAAKMLSLFSEGAP